MSDRATMISHMLRGIEPPLNSQQRHVVEQSLEAFSDSQMEKFDRAGLRFWPERWGVVPDYADFMVQAPPNAADERTHPAAYDHATRVVYYRRDSQRAITLIHELAHAWDDIRNDRGWELGALDGLEENARARMSQRLRRRRYAFASDSPQAAGPRHLSLRAMFAAYVQTTAGRAEQTFDEYPNPCGYSRTNLHEFYAVGYAVFHGGEMDAKSRLLQSAPDFYDYLEEEARAEGVPVPNRQQVRQHRRGPNFC